METALSDILRIVENPEEFAVEGAKLFRDAAEQAIAEQGRFSVALSGGSTPRMLFRHLGASYRKKIDWNRVHLFWSDERCVPRDHEQSNFKLAYDELISSIWIPLENVHRIKGELRPEEAAGYFEADMKKHFGEDRPVFDLIMLGVGPDGHTASLFPGSEALGEKQRLALPVFSSTALHWRVTLTLPVLNSAKQVLFLISGPSKAGIVSALLGKKEGNGYPAAMVKPSAGNITWLLDRDAASKLPEALA
ncbi:MAG: 6-phosphogluconolactonase [Nitrospirota bacterium]|nr:6-phosphogluconolactonase [Nitrospirota bacterium]